MAKLLKAVLILTWTSMGHATLGEFLDYNMPGKTAGSVKYDKLCQSMGLNYGGYSWKMGGGKTTFDVNCGGQQVEVVCTGWPKFSKCTSSSATGQSGGGCVCAAGHPTCKSNGWCYKGSSWSDTHCPGSCTQSAQTTCECPSTHPYCYSGNKWCYKSATSNSYTSQCGGECTQAAPSPPPPPPPTPPPSSSCKCPTSHPFCYSSNKWCYKSATSSSYSQTCGGKCTGSSASHQTTHGGQGAQVAATGSCGSEGFTQAEAQEMLDLHNKFRCAVGTPPIQWNAALQCQAQDTQNEIGAFSHSHSYDKPISSGENLATGTSPSTAAWMWFTEYTQSSNTGHYTAMVWKKSTEMGCGIQRSGGGVIRCQYAAAPPNFGGDSDYAENVPKFVGEASKLQKCGLTIAEVKQHVQQFQGWGILHPESQLSASLGLFETDHGETAWTNPLSKISTPLTAMAVAVFMVIGLAGIRRMRSSSGQEPREIDAELAKEYLAVEGTEALE